MTPSGKPIPPPPRRVSRSLGSGCGLWVLRLFILPHTLVGLGLLLAVPGRLVVLSFGSKINAIVENTTTGTTKKGRSYQTVHYHYDYAGRRHVDTYSPEASQVARPEPGDLIPGKVMGVAGYALFLPEASHPYRTTLFFAGMAVFWNGIVGVFFYMAWVAPLKQMWIAKYGASVEGKVTGKRVSRGKSTRYYVKYEFEMPAGEQLSGEESTNSIAYDSANEGQPVTVLYRADKPKWNLAAEYCSLRVE